jgi:predicted HicB family RNase H-like nuclease
VNSLEYKGYRGTFAYDDEATVLHGCVVGIRDVITFEGRSIEQLKKAFAHSIEDYLDFCRERGEHAESPGKPCPADIIPIPPPD